MLRHSRKRAVASQKLAAEGNVDSPDVGHLEPMVAAASDAPARAGVPASLRVPRE
jgi:hypothetical protein